MWISDLFQISDFVLRICLEAPAFPLRRKYGNGARGTAVLAAVILHAEFHVGNEGHLFAALIGILDDIRGTDAGAHPFTSVSTYALFLIQNKLNIAHEITSYHFPRSQKPKISLSDMHISGRSGFKPRMHRCI
jgi:hypothetical protein